MVTPSPLKEALPLAHADAVRSDPSAPEYSAGAPSHESTFDFPFQGRKRGKATNSGRNLHAHNAKKARPQNETELQPHGHGFDAQCQGLDVLNTIDLPSAADGHLQDSLVGAPFTGSGTDTLTPMFHLGALAPGHSDVLCDPDESRQAGFAGTGCAHETTHGRPDELHAASCDYAVTSSTGGRAFSPTANLLLPSQHHRRQSSLDSTAHAYRCSPNLRPSPDKINRRPSPPRLSRNKDQEDTQLPHDELTDDQFLELFGDETLYDQSFEAGLASDGNEYTRIIKAYSRHSLNARPIGNFLQAPVTSAIVRSQAYDGIENYPPCFAREASRGENNGETISSVVTNATLFGTAPSTPGRGHVSYTSTSTNREFFRQSPGNRSAGDDLG
jgi:hypothetical protein